VLDHTVDEIFTETEQVAFYTSHIVPGIDDPLFRGRNFSYFDTQISRLGINWEEVIFCLCSLLFSELTKHSCPLIDPYARI
jgi:catalase